MCGIAGILDLAAKRPIDEALLARMREQIRHRGPDGDGSHVEPGVGLAHRRLSIIDVSGGRQPIYNEDGSVVLVYNGEIYNYRELVGELVDRGHVFRTHCDTEVVVHAWEEWGEASVERFNGMFAFALFDRKRNQALLARDRLGIKPLYYAEIADGRILFASELKALLVHPDLGREIDPAAVEEFFAYGYIPEPRSIFRNTYKLEPGHTLLIDGGNARRIRRYWDVTFTGDNRVSEADLEKELIERLREAVSKRLMAEVPLGAFLSGGVDSSAVVAMMAGVSPDPVNTCSIKFGERGFDESSYAARVAERYGTSHQVQLVDPGDFGLVDQLADLYDEPYADSSAMPTYRVCELARKRVTVALSGDGGDENWAGYRRYRWHVYEERFRRALPAGLRRPLFGVLGRVYPKADWAPKVLRAKSTFEALARDSVEGYFHGVSILGDDLRRRLFSDGFRKRLSGYQAIEVLRRHAERAPEDPLSRVQYLDLKTYLVGDILTKVDRASMAHSLEVRVPILDHELVEWVASLPPETKLRGREGKYLFKKALEPYLPEDLLYRPKMGFAVPLASWFRGPLRERVRQVTESDALLDTGVFEPGFLRRMVDEHQSGVRDFSAALWSVLMFESFCRRSSGERREVPVEEPALASDSVR
jgi:asparagine synthase (glutamine-hydrolysing)